MARLPFLEIGKIDEVYISARIRETRINYSVSISSSRLGHIKIGDYDNLKEAETKFNELLQTAKEE